MIVSRITKVIYSVIGALVMFATFQLANAFWLLPTARDEGRELERAAALKKSIELIQKRGKTNDEVRVLDSGALCRELAGRWVPEQNRCE